MLYALLVAYVRQDVAEHREIAAVIGGDMEAALVHGGKKADGLDRHGFTAGIGSGYHQGVEALPQLQADGHGLGLVQQWMPGPAQDYALALHGGALAAELIGQLGLGKDKVQAHQDLKVRGDIVPVLGAVGGELRQDALYLQLLLGGELSKLVVGFHRRHGLDEQSGSRGGDIVDQAGHGPLVLSFHRHHVSVLAHGDYGLLQDLCITGRGDELL